MGKGLGWAEVCLWRILRHENPIFRHACQSSSRTWRGQSWLMYRESSRHFFARGERPQANRPRSRCDIRARSPRPSPPRTPASPRAHRQRRRCPHHQNLPGQPEPGAGGAEPEVDPLDGIAADRGQRQQRCGDGDVDPSDDPPDAGEPACSGRTSSVPVYTASSRNATVCTNAMMTRLRLVRMTYRRMKSEAPA